MIRAGTLLALLAATACGGGEPITAVTYNAGLAPGFVNGAESRTAPVGAAVAALDADFVCLQEVWTPADIASIKTATEGAFPHQLWPSGSQDTLPEAGCTEEELDKLLGCVDNACAEECPEYLDDCMLANCAVSFINVSETCQGCVMANVGGDVQAVRDTCAASFPQYAYEGAFGTALLSKHEILSSEHLEMSATTNRRGVHHAVVKGPAGKMDVYCTHLTAVFSLLPYPKEEGDWDVEQRAQADTLLSWVDDSAESKRVVILGDFNSGPGIEQATYDKFISAGYASTYAETQTDCTWCADNPLIGGGDDRIIDHVFSKGFDGERSGARVLDAAEDIEVCEETVPGALSDHYGVSVTLAP